VSDLKVRKRNEVSPARLRHTTSFADEITNQKWQLRRRGKVGVLPPSKFFTFSTMRVLLRRGILQAVKVQTLAEAARQNPH